MRGLLPELVVQRQTKAEFSVTYYRHFPEMRELLTRDIPIRRLNWINQGDVDILYSEIGKKGKCAGWSNWMLWILFGCDALVRDN